MAVRRASKRAVSRYVPIPEWTPNQLRHGIATLIKESQGHDAATAYLGHSTPDTTAIYAHRSRETIQKVAKELEVAPRYPPETPWSTTTYNYSDKFPPTQPLSHRHTLMRRI